ncbi:MAG TPA: hypothetical protein H9796_07250 [Candidatus Butyricimonas faecavium]|nr:hypothetical protein [Candidatus Butyricimonas faecavium]
MIVDEQTVLELFHNTLSFGIFRDNYLQYCNGYAENLREYNCYVLMVRVYIKPVLRNYY